MSVALTNVNLYRLGRLWAMEADVAFSGNYPGDPGETLSFAAASLKLRQTTRGAGRVPVWVNIQGAAGFSYPYKKGTTRDNGKVQVRVNDAGGANAPNAQHTTAAYAAGVTGDTIRLFALFAA